MTAALKVSNLKKTYKNGTVALKGLNLEVEAGEIFALLGPNGAGKSTLIGIISSLVTASSGDVEVFGDNLTKQRNKVKSHIGLVPQEFNFNMFEKPMDILVNQAGYYGVPRKTAIQRAEKYLKQLQLWDKRKSMSRMLSGGMKRRLMIARAMMNEPKLLILDEPTAGVDIEIRRSMWEFVEEIANAGTTIILTTHYLEEAEQLCKNVAIINHGEIIKNTTIKQLLTTLDIETFILDLDKKPEADLLKALNAEVTDENSIQIDVPKSKALNESIKTIDEMGYKVLSMRNKVNRLEELFYKMTQEQKNEGE
ncbi:MAG TPA: ABC transporter ATP-binding protein [Gammaproteobacteria bacterium]|jgi:ABC-2 type transport system ATP-binding protein|nr:ABC transporter ATP-binding protein [Xanthomonadales bacterium]MCB1603356.1 ABC transporter ATP-binding protein [Xanthomonadales bacterium]HOP21371.1 ABC transporter ATP-binding protein [Gammaproteobacteria bacterium]HPI94769.1 ABC transporter ATP-binding protein [Gammaproteobacteria bacterium]HPQ86362.1 ABC transporter ATP-binding protein [Gammaproteobacteria bacterium]